MDKDQIEQAAKLLAQAQHPLLITANGGRTAEGARGAPTPSDPNRGGRPRLQRPIDKERR